MKIKVTKVLGPLAQRLVQRTHNPLVDGSNPSGPTSFHELTAHTIWKCDRSCKHSANGANARSVFEFGMRRDDGAAQDLRRAFRSAESQEVFGVLIPIRGLHAHDQAD